MLPYTGDFATSINGQARDINVVIAYKNGESFVYLQKDNIQSLTLNSKVNKSLGGVIKRVADIKALYNEYTSNLAKGMAINIYYMCGTGMCKKALLYINQVKVNDKNKVMTIEAVDYLSYAQINTSVGMVKNTRLVDYEKVIFNSLGWQYEIDNTVANPMLSLGYPKGTKLVDTLEEMAIANNAIIDFSFEIERGLKLPFTIPTSFAVKVNTAGYILPSENFKLHVDKFAFSNTAVDTLDKTNDIISFEKDDDNSDQYSDVKVNLFFPSSSEMKSLGKVNTTVPGATQQYYIGSVDFGNTMIPQVCCFSGDVDIDSYTLGSSSCAFTINNSGVNAKNIDVEFFGYDIAESTLKNTDNDSNVKQISNMYIQSATAYDKRIFLNPNCTIRGFGNPLHEIGDTITVGDDTVLILEQTLTFSGGLKGTTKGVLLNG